MKKIVNIGIAVLVAASLLWFLLSQISFKSIVEIFQRIPKIFILAAFVAYVCSFLFRSIRYKILIKELPLKSLFDILCVHNLMVNVLPARTGEVSFIYLVKKSGVRGTKAASTLIIGRIFDFFSILILLLFSSMFIGKLEPAIQTFVYLITIFVFSLMCCLLFFVYFSSLSLRIAKRVFHILKIENLKYSPYLMEKLEFLLNSFEIVKVQNKFFSTLALSIMIFVMQFFTMYILILGMGIQATFISSMFALTLFFFLTTLPIQSLVGLGTYESFWALAFISAGIDKGLAISSGFVAHMLSITFFLLVGLYGLSQLRLKKKII